MSFLRPMAKTSYYDKLRDPRWQKKRLEIMERDGFKCLFCTASKDTLNVHHRWYETGRDPWDYDDDVFQTLCEVCHKRTEDLLKSIRKSASVSQDSLRYGEIILKGLADLEDMEGFSGAVKAFGGVCFSLNDLKAYSRSNTESLPDTLKLEIHRNIGRLTFCMTAAFFQLCDEVERRARENAALKDEIEF